MNKYLDLLKQAGLLQGVETRFAVEDILHGAYCNAGDTIKDENCMEDQARFDEVFNESMGVLLCDGQSTAVVKWFANRGIRA